MVDPPADGLQLLFDGALQSIAVPEVRRLLTQPDHLLRQGGSAGAAIGPHLAEGRVHPQLPAFLLHQLQLRLRVGGEGVDGHHAGQAEHVFDIVHMLEQVGQSPLQGR